MTHDEIFDTLNGTAGRIEAIVEKLGDGQLQQRSANGDWSIKELVGHLRDAAVMYGERISRVASEDKPSLPGYDQDKMLEEGRYQTREIGSVIGELNGLDKQTLDLLRGLREEDWLRGGIHEERGPQTLEDIVQYYANHEREHLAEIDERAQEVSGGESL